MPLKADCTVHGGRLIYNCGYDTAGDILRHTLPNIDGSVIQSKDKDWTSNGVLQKFDQSEFIDSSFFGYTGLAKYGFVYYPNQCIDGRT